MEKMMKKNKGGYRKNGGRSCLKEEDRRVQVSFMVTRQTREYICKAAKDAGGSMGEAVDALVETARQADEHIL